MSGLLLIGPGLHIRVQIGFAANMRRKPPKGWLSLLKTRLVVTLK